MNTNHLRSVVLAAVLIVLLVVSACGPAPAAADVTPAVNEAQAREMAENALAALNAGDYSAWSRDWDASMKAAIKEADFLAFRDQVLGTYGQYVSIEGLALRPGQQSANVRWEVTAHFENGDIMFAFVFPKDGSKVAGLHQAPVE